MTMRARAMNARVRAVTRGKKLTAGKHVPELTRSTKVTRRKELTTGRVLPALARSMKLSRNR